MSLQFLFLCLSTFRNLFIYCIHTHFSDFFIIYRFCSLCWCLLRYISRKYEHYFYGNWKHLDDFYRFYYILCLVLYECTEYREHWKLFVFLICSRSIEWTNTFVHELTVGKTRFCQMFFIESNDVWFLLQTFAFYLLLLF